VESVYNQLLGAFRGEKEKEKQQFWWLRDFQ
jgi:hypothetical protein